MNWSKPLRNEHQVMQKARKGLLRQWLKQGKGTEQDFVQRIIDSMLSASSSGHITESPASQQLTDELNARGVCLYALLLREEFISRDIVSIYLDTAELKAFLLDTECVRDFDAIHDYICNHGKRCDDVKFLAIHLRVPGERDAYSYVLTANSDKVLHIYEVCGGWENTGRISRNDMSLAFPDEYKLILNFIYYVLTFPDALIDGKPKAAEPDPEHALAPKFSLRTHPKLIDHRETVPGQSRVTHFRRGHFRHLISDWYKAKKGQWVFVPRTLVKGAPAKTLI